MDGGREMTLDSSYFISVRHMTLKDINTNDNARNIGQRPGSGKGSTSGLSGGSFRQKRANRNDTHSTGNVFTSTSQSSDSFKPVSPSQSFETPLGIVKRSSSSGIEPVRMHSGTSQESFRRGLSVFKMNALPALTEDADHSDDDCKCETNTASTHMRSKTKGKKCKKSGKHETGTRYFEQTENRTEGLNCLQRLFERVCKCASTDNDNAHNSEFTDLR